LAREGTELALADIDMDGLNETGELVRESGGKVSVHRLDVADPDAVADFARLVVDEHKKVNVLINNAGVLLCDTLEDCPYDDFEWLMNVNFWGSVYVTKAFLPHLKNARSAHIVNMSSVAGLVTTPCNGPYAISKAALKAFSETLAQELRRYDIGVSCVIAGGVRTGIFRKAPRFRSATPRMTSEQCVLWYENAAKTTPEQAAKTIVKGIKRRKSRILIGPDSHIIDFFCRITPSKTSKYAGLLMSNLNRFRPPWAKDACSVEMHNPLTTKRK
jgi:short-subunit dehydrogenase